MEAIHVNGPKPYVAWEALYEGESDGAYSYGRHAVATCDLAPHDFVTIVEGKVLLYTGEYPCPDGVECGVAVNRAIEGERVFVITHGLAYVRQPVGYPPLEKASKMVQDVRTAALERRVSALEADREARLRRDAAIQTALDQAIEQLLRVLDQISPPPGLARIDSRRLCAAQGQ